MTLSLIAKRAIDVSGDSGLWINHAFIEAEVSLNGLAFRLKRRPFFEQTIINIEIALPFSVLKPIGKEALYAARDEFTAGIHFFATKSRATYSIKAFKAFLVDQQ